MATTPEQKTPAFEPFCSIIFKEVTSLATSNDEVEASLFHRRLHGKIVEIQEDLDAPDICCGTLDIILIEVLAGNSAGFSTEEIFDDSSEAYECYRAIFDGSELKRSIRNSFDIGCSGFRIMLMSRMEISERARGHNLGLLAVRQAIELYGQDSFVVCKPFPLQFENKRDTGPEFQAAQKKLRAYWSRMGFRRIGKSDFYGLNTELRGIDLEDIRKAGKEPTANTHSEHTEEHIDDGEIVRTGN